MAKFFLYAILMSSIFISQFNIIKAEESKDKPELKFGTKAYMAYEAVYPNMAPDSNSFQARRAYLTMKAKLSDLLSFRMTLDVYNDDDGVESRMKYLYADFHFPDFSIITKPHLEFGIVHTPWLDFEEHINWYRMQGTMYLERVGLFNSADFGFTVMGYLGGLVDENYQKEVSKKYPGRYGSFAFGVYNGGGYHNFEQNNNKTVQGRVTLRPLPDIIPGLQLTGLGIFGKVNNEKLDPEFHSDWKTLVGMISYEHKYFTLTGQFVTGEGNKKGSMIEEIYGFATPEDSVESLLSVRNKEYLGFSFFGEIKPDDHWRIIGRYDYFQPDNYNDTENGKDYAKLKNNRMIIGLGYDFGHHNVLIIDYDRYDTDYFTTDDDDNVIKDTESVSILKATMQISF